MAINPCTSLNEVLEAKISALETIQTGVAPEISSTLSTLNDFEGAATNVSELTSILGTLSESTLGAGSEDMDKLKLFTGSCLDKVKAKVNEMNNDLISTVGDALNDISSFSEKEISQTMQVLKNYIGNLQIPGLISDIDRLLGCMIDSGLSDCTSVVSGFSSRVNNVLSSLYLDTDGSFNMNTIMDASTMDSDVKTNLILIQDKLDIIKINIEDNINTTLSNVVPSSYF